MLIYVHPLTHIYTTQKWALTEIWLILMVRRNKSELWMRCWVSKSGFDEKIHPANLENVAVVGILIFMMRCTFNWQAIVLLGKSFLYLSITDLYHVLLRLYKTLSVNDRTESLGVCIVGINCKSRGHLSVCACVCMRVSMYVLTVCLHTAVQTGCNECGNATLTDDVCVCALSSSSL